MSSEGHARDGILYVVGTPIGNLDDLSARAIDVLKKVSAIAAEDTRRTSGLLSRIGVKASLIAHHEHNERERAARLLDRVAAGESIALVSDAGMPTISDPGWYLVAQAHARKLRVVSVPGPSALTAALSVAGLPTDRFVFEGFLPRRASARRARLEALRSEPRTLVFFESVHRLRDSVAAMLSVLGGERRAAILRELTKLHETCYTGTLAELAARLDDDLVRLGEFVIVIGGAPAQVAQREDDVERVFTLLESAVSPREAVALTAAITGVPRNEVYRRTRARS